MGGRFGIMGAGMIGGMVGGVIGGMVGGMIRSDRVW